MRVAAALNRHALQLTRTHGDDLEAVVEARRLRVAREPALGGDVHPAQLLLADHLERVAVAVPGLPLHFAEDDLAAAADDQVELVASCPDVGAQDAVAAETVVP